MLSRLSLVAAIGLLSSIAGTANAGLVFDNCTNFRTSVPGAGLTSTGTTPNTFMGGAYDLQSDTTAITGFDLFAVNLSGTAFTGLKLNVFVWGNVNTGTVNAANPAFSNLLGSYSFTTGTGSFSSGFYYSFTGAVEGTDAGVTLATPLAISSPRIGVTINIQGTTNGTTYSNVNSLTSGISYGTPATVGSNVFNAYYRNAAGETNGNFTSTLRSLGLTNQSIGLRVYGVPTPGSLALLAPAGLLIARRRRA